MATAKLYMENLGTLIADATVTTPQTIFTVPNGARAVVLHLVFRNAAAQLNAATTFSVGFDANATDWATTGQTGLQSFGASTLDVAQIARSYTPSGTKTTSHLGLDGNTFKIAFGGTLTSNSTVVVDAMGYLL